MRTFGLIAEGETDQRVLRNILVGFFEDEDEEPAMVPVQPKVDEAGGWTRVFNALKEGRHREALSYVDYLVVQIDTDVCDEPGYDVSRRDAEGKPHSPADLVQAVAARLTKAMGADFFAEAGSRVILAIAVDSIECWLLPLLFDQRAKKAKVSGCEEAANKQLERRNEKPLSTRSNKFLHRYEAVSRPYTKRKVLLAHRAENPSLDLFVASLEGLATVPTSGRP